MTDSLRINGFTAYAMESHGTQARYRDGGAYHKMLLISGIGEIEYDDAFYEIQGAVLLFTKPGVSCSWSLSNSHRPTYICTFKSDFVDSGCIRWSEHCQNHFTATPVFLLNADHENFIRAIFCRMIENSKTSYAYKEELIQNQLCVLKHMALQMTGAIKLARPTARVMLSCSVSIELVEIGFPLAGQTLHFN